MRTGGLDPFQPVCIGGFREFIDKPAESPAVDSGGQYATCLRAAQLGRLADFSGVSVTATSRDSGSGMARSAGSPATNEQR